LFYDFGTFIAPSLKLRHVDGDTGRQASIHTIIKGSKINVKMESIQKGSVRPLVP
jgi:hypothetical protein